jgi:hypothetical protein
VRPKMFTPHPTMSSAEISDRTQAVWDKFYNWSAVWKRSACVPNLKARVAFMMLSKLYRQMYAGTGISTDSARRKKAKRTARWMVKQTSKIFRSAPMPELQSPVWALPSTVSMLRTALNAGMPAETPFVVLPKS